MPKLKPIRTYSEHKKKWSNCTRCSLHKTRNKVVLGRGTIPCDILFIGEAPGQSEDTIGRPFVGPAGKLFDRIIEDTWKKAGEEVDTGGVTPDGRFIQEWAECDLTYAVTNVVSCMPVDYEGAKVHAPDDEACEACFPRLKEFVRLAKPRAIITVGDKAKEKVYGEAMFSNRKPNDEENGVEWTQRLLPDGYIHFGHIYHPARIMRADVTQQGLMVQKAQVEILDIIERLRIPF